MKKRKKTLYTFYSEVFYGDQDEFKTDMGKMCLDRYFLSFKIGEYSLIHSNDMHRFPYPKLTKKRKLK